MKKLLIFIAVLAFCHSSGFAQGCLPEGITFTNQTQIDSFQINYPGCTEIEGDVNIHDYGYWSGIDITNLNGLNVITSICGNLSIQCFILPSLAGLDALTSVGGDLSFGGYNMNGGISGNPLLTSLTGLEGLTYLGGNLTVIGNTSLISLTGLENVAAASIDNINIHDNAALTTCNIESICEYLAAPNGSVDIYHNAPGCDSPAEITSSCGFTLPCLPYGNYYFFSQDDVDNFPTDYPGCSDLQGDVSITGDDIVNLSGLSQVTSVGSNLNIGRYFNRTPVGNPQLTNLTGLENLTHIGGTLMIINNDTLSSLTGLENLTTIDQSLLIGISYVFPTRNMGALTSISSLGNLDSIGGELYISSTSLTDLSGLENLASVHSITLYSNALLSDISSLSNLTHIPGSLDIWHTSVSSLAGLDHVDTIGGRVLMAENNIENFEGMDALTYIGGGAWIFQNSSLTSLEGLNNLKYIEGYLDLWQNPSLESLSGLENLDSIGSYLHISQNALKSLTALSGLQSLKGSLYVVYNDNLTSLSGIDNLFTDSISELKIFYNSHLQTCDVESICDYLAGPHGTVEIYSNAPGCNSPEEVEAACQVGVESCSSKAFTIFPNPTTGLLTIETPGNLAKSQLTILNLSGQEVMKKSITEPTTQLDISCLPAGLYIVGLANDKTVETVKFIKH